MICLLRNAQLWRLTNGIQRAEGTRERDEVAEARQGRDVAKGRRRGCVEDQDRGLELLPEIVREAVEEPPEHGMRTLQGSNASIVGGGERRDLATDHGFQRNIRQDEYRRPIGGHVLILILTGKHLLG